MRVEAAWQGNPLQFRRDEWWRPPFSEDQRQFIKAVMADAVKEALQEEREKDPALMDKQLAPQDTDRPGTSSAYGKP